MKRGRFGAGVLVGVVMACAGYLTLLSFGFFAAAAELRPVPAGHREIIFLAPATSGAPRSVHIENAPDADIYPIEVSFQALKDETERTWLN